MEKTVFITGADKGPDADIHPDTSAEGIFGLTVKDWQPGDGMFMDYDASPRRW